MGTRHACLITRGGELYTWGYGKCGTLGQGSQHNASSPKQVIRLRGRGVRSISCSDASTAGEPRNATSQTVLLEESKPSIPISYPASRSHADNPFLLLFDIPSLTTPLFFSQCSNRWRRLSLHLGPQPMWTARPRSQLPPVRAQASNLVHQTRPEGREGFMWPLSYGSCG